MKMISVVMDIKNPVNTSKRGDYLKRKAFSTQVLQCTIDSQPVWFHHDNFPNWTSKDKKDAVIVALKNQ